MRKNFILHIFMSLACFSLFQQSLLSLPTGAAVDAGNVDLSHVDSQNMVITASDKAIINYDSFNIAEHEKVTFVQPSSSSCVLNRVQGKEVSSILGQMQSNGRVFLVNPYGIYFGPNAQINVGSLIASTMDISNQNFLNDRFEFFLKPGTESSQIINMGSLSSNVEGVIALLSPHVKNEGVINAKSGKVAIASGEKVTLDFHGDGLFSFVVEGEVEKALIENAGKIQAAGGEITLRLRVADRVIKEIVNSDGIAEGTVIAKADGVIRILSSSQMNAQNVALDAGPHSKVDLQGKIDVSNSTSEQKGGIVHVLGDEIALQSVVIDASGNYGGGTVLVGGDYQGKGEVHNALTTSMDEHSIIYANAIEKGDGGKVILWSNGDTVFEGKIHIQGGSTSGNGGFAETSGVTGLLSTTGVVDGSSLFGDRGQWRLDPIQIIISATGGCSPWAAGNCDSSLPTCFIDVETINSSLSNLTLCASNQILINSPINIANPGVNIAFQAAPSSTITTVFNNSPQSITTNGGNVIFSTNNNVRLEATTTINTNGADVFFGGAISGPSVLSEHCDLIVNAGGGTVSFAQEIDSPFGGKDPSNLYVSASTINATQVHAESSITFNAPSAINLSNGAMSVPSGEIVMNGPVNIESNYSFNSGSLEFLSTLDGGAVALQADTVSFNADVGGNVPLASLEVKADEINIAGNISTSSQIDGHIVFDGPVILREDVSISTTSGGPGAPVTFTGEIEGNVIGRELYVNAGTADVAYQGEKLIVGPDLAYHYKKSEERPSLEVGDRKDREVAANDIDSWIATSQEGSGSSDPIGSGHSHHKRKLPRAPRIYIPEIYYNPGLFTTIYFYPSVYDPTTYVAYFPTPLYWVEKKNTDLSK